jgi:YegS/Rv2252/BmrU family lipid kinase
MQKYIALICNPVPDNSKTIRIADDIAVALSTRDIRYSLFTTYWPQQWNDFTEVWIVGGDGTLNYFINQYSHLSLPITVFKGGSGNDFHWMMYGNIMLNEQVEKVLQGQAQYIDAGECNGNLFLNGVGIGFDGAIVKDLLGKRKVGGKASYLLSILKNIVAYHEKHYEIHTTNTQLIQDCFLISVANGKRYGGGFTVAPKASVSDGLLDVNVIGKIPPIKRLKYLPVIEKGEHLELPFVHYEQTNKVIIHTSVPVHAHVDGEYVYTDHFEISCLSKKILFFV